MIAALRGRFADALERAGELLAAAAERVRGRVEYLFVTASRDEAIAVAAADCASGEYVVIHEYPCADDKCRCTHPEVHRIERGRA